MKHVALIVFTVGLLGLWVCPAVSHNPFTSKPESQHKAPEPLLKSRIFVKIIVWQQQLRQQMSDLVRISRNERRIKPLLVLLGIAFLYGAIHAAGPGHGKVVATTYVLSHRATMVGGILFGVSFAVIHAMSGAVGVIGLKYIIDKSVSESLNATTSITQMVSYGLITALGFFILVKHGAALRGSGSAEKHYDPKTASKKGIIPWAAAVGQCPARRW